MSDFIFDDLNTQLDSCDAKVYSQSAGLIPAGDHNVEVIKARLDDDDDSSRLSLHVQVVGGDFDGAKKWLNFQLRGGKFDWLRERDIKFLKQVQLASNLGQIKSDEDFVGLTFGIRLTQRGEYTNLKRIFKEVPKPTTKDSLPQSTETTKSENTENPFF